MKIYFALMMMAIAGLSACSSQPPPPGVKIGKPYVIDGKTYYPEYDATYDKIGDASWYGPGFHGKYTANGEIFNQNDLTAAHPTLPMPSLVRVTNLENGKSAIIRVNDRGPFKSNRIIDLSKASAQKLGVHSIHRVRVQYLHKETQEYLASLNNGEAKTMKAFNSDAENAKNDSVIAATEPSPQIVESTQEDTKPGQTVNNAAPILSVNTDDIAQSVASTEKEKQPRKSPFIREAMADDTVSGAAGPAPRPQVSVVESIDVKPVEIIHDDSLKNKDMKPVGKQQKPAAKSAPAASGGYVIQVGSFSQEANAAKMADILRSISSISISAFTEKVELGGKTWFRVRVGPFDSAQAAQPALEKVRATGAVEARIVQQ